MFGLSLIQERLAFLGIIVAIVLGFAWHERYVGGQKCLRNVEKANAVETAKEDKQHTTDLSTVTIEGKTYAAAKSAPLATPAPVIRMCPKLPGKTVLGPAEARPSPDDGAPGGGGNSSQPTIWDTTPLVKTGRDADAQIRGLQDYIITVCRPK